MARHRLQEAATGVPEDDADAGQAALFEPRPEQAALFGALPER